MNGNQNVIGCLHTSTSLLPDGQYSKVLPFKKLDFKKLKSDFSKQNALLLETQQAVFCNVSYMI